MQSISQSENRIFFACHWEISHSLTLRKTAFTFCFGLLPTSTVNLCPVSLAAFDWGYTSQFILLLLPAATKLLVSQLSNYTWWSTEAKLQIHVDLTFDQNDEWLTGSSVNMIRKLISNFYSLFSEICMSNGLILWSGKKFLTLSWLNVRYKTRSVNLFSYCFQCITCLPGCVYLIVIVQQKLYTGSVLVPVLFSFWFTLTVLNKSIFHHFTTNKSQFEPTYFSPNSAPCVVSMDTYFFLTGTLTFNRNICDDNCKHNDTVNKRGSFSFIYNDPFGVFECLTHAVGTAVWEQT